MSSLFKPFLSKQPTTGGKKYVTIWWVPSLWYSVTPPSPLKNPDYAHEENVRENSTVDNVTFIPLQFFICLFVILGLEIAAGVLGYVKRNEVCVNLPSFLLHINKMVEGTFPI